MLQLPWPTPCQGLVLVVDIWSGLAGLLVTLLALWVRFIAISAEVDPHLATAVEINIPNVNHTNRVEDITG